MSKVKRCMWVAMSPTTGPFFESSPRVATTAAACTAPGRSAQNRPASTVPMERTSLRAKTSIQAFARQSPLVFFSQKADSATKAFLQTHSTQKESPFFLCTVILKLITAAISKKVVTIPRCLPGALLEVGAALTLSAMVLVNLRSWWAFLKGGAHILRCCRL
jgi:hypothetical protein